MASKTQTQCGHGERSRLDVRQGRGKKGKVTNNDGTKKKRNTRRSRVNQRSQREREKKKKNGLGYVRQFCMSHTFCVLSLMP